MRLSARKLLGESIDNLHLQLTGDFTLVFDDGEIETNAKETLLSRYFWEPFKWHPEMQLKVCHHIQPYLNSPRFRANDHCNIISNVVKEFYDAEDRTPNKEYFKAEIEDLLCMCYDGMNAAYNYFATHFRSLIPTIDITDMLQIVTDPFIRKCIDNTKITPAAVRSIYQKINDYLIKDPKFKDNNAVHLMIAALIKVKQLNQSIGPFGFPTDMDNYIFIKHPITHGFFEGLQTPYEILTESRNAAISLQLQKVNLRKVEYGNRKTQLLGMQLERVHHGDCGSKHYITYNVLNKKKLASLDGIFMLTNIDKNGKHHLHAIDGKKDTFLIGKYIAIRNVNGCQHTDPNGVCMTCFGLTGRNVVKGTNVGQQAVICMTGKNSQDVLSTKHIIGSGEVNTIKLSPIQDKFFKVSKEGNGYILKDTLDKETLAIKLDEYSMRNITYVLRMKSRDTISPQQATNIKNIVVINKPKGKDYAEEILVPVTFEARDAYATRDFLDYMIERNWKIDSKGCFIVPMDQWDFSKVIFKCESKQFNTAAFAKSIEIYLESKAKDAAIRNDMSPIEHLNNFMSCIEVRQNLNFSVLQTIPYVTNLVNAINHDYSLPKPWTNKGVGTMKDTMISRSLSGALAYENHENLVKLPSNFVYTNRPDNVFDWMVTPNALVHYYQEQGIPY